MTLLFPVFLPWKINDEHAAAESATHHIGLHSDEPGAAGSWWVFLVRPVGRLDLSLRFCQLAPTERLVWNKPYTLHKDLLTTLSKYTFSSLISEYCFSFWWFWTFKDAFIPHKICYMSIWAIWWLRLYNQEQILLRLVESKVNKWETQAPQGTKPCLCLCSWLHCFSYYVTWRNIACSPALQH